METNNGPLVSVPVITYNSAKTVLETLDSIKAQTYQNIELIISDDCSTDNTLQLIYYWTDKNKDRFSRVQILEAQTNQGISANGNKAREACHGEWIKGIAGDDILMPDCIMTCMDYVNTHDHVYYLFGRVKCFGAEEKRCEEVDAFFDYSFFSLSQEQQLHRLLFEGNCIPASTCFYNREKTEAVGVKYDDRVPLLEDWAKWINLLRNGVDLHFVDSYLVKYRVGGISTSQMNLPYFKSNRLMFFYYQYPEWTKENFDWAVNQVVECECAIYEDNLKLRHQLNNIHSSFIYKCYQVLLYPILSFVRSHKRQARNIDN